MPSFRHRGRKLLLTLPFMLLASALSACTTTGPLTLYAPSCFTQMTQAESLRKRVPHAPVPAVNKAGAWVATANAEGGQLDKANARGDTILHIGDTCDRWQAEAKKQAEKRSILKRIFG